MKSILGLMSVTVTVSEDGLSPGDDRSGSQSFWRHRRRRRRTHRRRLLTVKHVVQHPAELVPEAQHQQKVDGGIEHDQTVRDRRVDLKPARVVHAGGPQRGVDRVEDEAEQRDRPADGKHEHDHDRKSRRAQLALLRRIQHQPVASGFGEGRDQSQVEHADDDERNCVDDDTVHGGVVDAD